MLTTPWTVTATDCECTVFAARLPLRSARGLPTALAWAWRIRRRLAAASGLAGHAEALDLSAPAVWTVSAWTSRTELARFDRSDPHQRAKATLRPWLRPPTFAVWRCDPADLPVPWAEVRARIDAAAQRT